MNLSSYQYANQSSYPSRGTPLHATQAGMYGGSNSNNVSIGHGSSGATTAAPPHAAMYAAAPASAAQPSAYGGGLQSSGSSGAPPHITQQAPQGTAVTYNAYSGPNTCGPTGRPANIFYSNSSMAGHPVGAGGQPMYQTNTGSPATLFQMNPSSSLGQASPAARMLSPQQQQQQQQQQLNANAAAMAAYGNPATNINVGYKLFVGQVPAVCTEEQLRPLFGQFGRLLEVKIMRESNGRSRGSAWVRYESEASAQRAIEALNEKHVVPPQTNALRVQFATPNQNRPHASSLQLQPAPLQAPQLPSASTRTVSAFIAPSAPQQQPHQQQPSYGATSYAAASNTATTTTYLSQGPYTSNVISYGSSDGAFAVRAPLQNPHHVPQQHLPPQQQQQQFPGRMEYVRAGQSGGGMLYTTSLSAAATPAGAMQQAQRQGPPLQPQPQSQPQPQQHQLLYATGAPMRTGVVYAPEGFTMTDQIPSSHPSQQHQQWRN